MLVEKCIAGICFAKLDASSPELFGFSEFLAGLALMILAWTIADVRYRFRVRTAPVPLQSITFSVVVSVGLLTLLTDLWRAEQWLVPSGDLISPAIWQAILACVFLLTFLTWTWYAFIRPPIYGRRNAERYAQTLFRFVLKGSPADLSVVADELANSASSLVRFATNRDRLRRFKDGEDDEASDRTIPKAEAFANDILLLIADKRLCKAIVASSPATALAIFQEISKNRKYGIQVGTFAKNIVSEAIANKESFLYHEAEGYESGLIGYIKPLSQSMFSNYAMVEEIGTMLRPDFQKRVGWDFEQWQAYCRVVLITLRDYVEKGNWNHSSVLYDARECLDHAMSDLYKLNGIPDTWENDSVRRLNVIIEFICEAVKILDRKGLPAYYRLRIREENRYIDESFYDQMARLIFQVIYHASGVRSPQWECWSIQHNDVWSELFRFNKLNGPATKVIRFKVRRLLYEEVARMEGFPNFKGARIIGFCLNVMGLELGQIESDRDGYALHKVVISWVRKHYAWLHSYNPRIAEDCLVDGMTFDIDSLRLVKTYPAVGLRREPFHVYLQLDPTRDEVEAGND